MPAPYVIRDEAGYWHNYVLPTAWNDKPIGVSLIVYIQPGEMLDCETITHTLRTALSHSPKGEWYRITVAVRLIRSEPRTNATIVYSLQRGDRVQIFEQVSVSPGKWAM